MTNMLKREFEFFVTTEEPHQPEGMQRGLIRRLVMRNFFEMKCKGAYKGGESPELSSEATIKAKARLKTRFRLGRLTVDKTRFPKRLKTGEEDWQARRRGTIETSVGLLDKSLQDIDNKIRSCGMSLTEDDGEELDRTEDTARLLVNISPSAYRCDPFDVLPVPGTQQLDLLFRLRTSPFFFSTPNQVSLRGLDIG
jgi:hypothetical protein